MLNPMNAEQHEGTLLVQHSEAVLAIRRHIIDKAKTVWREAKDVNTNHVLGFSQLKQESLDRILDGQVTNMLGWQRGETFSDQNCAIIYNTFLEEDDPRLLE